MTVYEISSGSEVLLRTTDISKAADAFTAWQKRLPNVEAHAIMMHNITDSFEEQST